MGVKVTLKALRVNRELTQKQAGDKVGVSTDTWSSWEHAKTFPDVKQLQTIEKEFDVHYDDLIFL
ncbi:helix-turn-helix transcriptional regulator [Weissella paramesenteroides]|uniref:helix-turn-helix transcriptional regulator n=1 Tax=Weissella paramesenteroides TaxID=1249 RepID=UPI00123BAEF5|nr:helix-turn-helix transcriptional regulator [Weissella paramesenteroides]KAA8442677.1 helix-turn-helix transcriptional regulator [Weissella paramesenteroides]KAA8443023.1 helix-turn-helix transcriptional regulator [Weissella paramesenteroides]KAA8444301.1 helix-turn-helix transcriptional regulator [Weissella paramesenteroides]KAA8447969.1 helix-turn-helix transcriptional regulator [Weissella paramesenteroides]KAA8452218.1 helix-turn-helix transcriptional regulator [Weissella paramesenteroide